MSVTAAVVSAQEHRENRDVGQREHRDVGQREHREVGTRRTSRKGTRRTSRRWTWRTPRFWPWWNIAIGAGVTTIRIIIGGMASTTPTGNWVAEPLY